MMSRRSFMGAISASAVAPSLAHGANPPLNVLYISSDEHNPAMMGDHPFVSTPNLDRLAARSLSCRQSYVASPVCAPTRQSG